MSAPKRRRTVESPNDESTDSSDTENCETEKFVDMLLKKHSKTKMQCGTYYVEITRKQDWNVVLEWLQKHDEQIYEKMTCILSKEEQGKLVELNSKKPNTRPIDVNPVYVAKIKVDGKHYFMPDSDAKAYAFVVNTKLKYFHMYTEKHGITFVAFKVDITPLENAVIDWYFNHDYIEHVSRAKNGGRYKNVFAIFYQSEEFSARPRGALKKIKRTHCRHVSDRKSCLANIDYCIFVAQLKFHFNPHSGLERHCHNSDSEWTFSEDDSEPEPEVKEKPKPFTAPRVKITDADFKAEAKFAMSNRNKLNLVEPGTKYKYFKGKPHPSTNSFVWQCSQQNRTIGRCNARALVKKINKKEMVAFTGTHNH